VRWGTRAAFREAVEAGRVVGVRVVGLKAEGAWHTAVLQLVRNPGNGLLGSMVWTRGGSPGVDEAYHNGHKNWLLRAIVLLRIAAR
jgi:hypothetical protein